METSEAPPDRAVLAQERIDCPGCGSGSSRHERLLAGFTLERCTACGLVFVNPRPTEQALTCLYLTKPAEREAEFYARTVSPAQITEYDRILADVIALDPRGRRLLDLGCAAGYFMQRAIAAGFDVHGIDLATWVEQIAAVRGVPNIRACRLRDAGFPVHSFDVVHSSQVFEHLPHPLDELREVRRILRPGGILYINVPNYRCLSIIAGRDDFELNTPPEHVTYFTPASLARLLTKAGFEVVRSASYGGLKWENLLGRPIKSEIAEVARAGKDPEASAWSQPAPRLPHQASAVGRLAREFFYRRLQVGMTLEIFARQSD